MKILIAIPALNEEAVLKGSIEKVRAFIAARLPEHRFVIVIVDNGSDDRTEEIGRAMQAEGNGVRYLRLGSRGKGLAIRSGWASEEADVFVFMDADLSTDLEALPELIAAIQGGADVAVGSRFHERSKVSRSRARKTLSAGYRLLLKGMFGTSIADVPCGFKAVSATVVREMVPKVKDQRWFFDTELVLRCERAGYRLHEVPVVWRDFRPAGTASKVVVGRLVAEYLRQCLRLWGELRRDEGKRGRGEVSRDEWKWVFGLAAAAMVLTSIPPLYGAWLGGQRDMVWKGLQFLSPGDFAVYLSYIEQVKNGRWLLENMFTTERLVPTFNVFWLGVGVMAKVFSLSPVAAFHAARVALIPALAAVSYAFIARFFAYPKQRLLAFLVFMFGSGLGPLYAIFFGPETVAGRYAWPIDLWVSEANTFLTMLYSPHFIASLALLLLALHLMLRAFGSGRVQHAVQAGLAALALFAFHPFHVPTLYFVPLVFLLGRALRGRPLPRGPLLYAIYVAVSAPAVVYHYYLTHYDALAATLVEQNTLLTPSLLHVLIGFGLISILWLPGAWLERRGGEGDADRDFLVAWIIAQTALVYSPISFQRRMLEGLEFPLVMLAVPALVWAYRRLVLWCRGDRVQAGFIAAAGFCAFFLPATTWAMVTNIGLYMDNRPPIFYFTREEDQALQWIRQRTAADAVFLGASSNGNAIAGWAGRRVYAGHWVATVNADRKELEVGRFFSGQKTDRFTFLHENGIDYVYWGRAEKAYGGDLSSLRFLRPVYGNGDVVIFEVLR